MKLYYSPASPFVRKVLVVAHEKRCADRIEILSSKADPIRTDMSIAADNPLGQVPTFYTDTGQVLFDSRVICEYLDAVTGGGLLPTDDTRWSVAVRHSVADGILDAALLARYERVARPPEYRWDAWDDSLMRKIERSLDLLERDIGDLDGVVDLGTVAVGCALGYLDFRFPDYSWRNSHPALTAWYQKFSERPSMKLTTPHT
ncbi:glutathione S-transferase [Microvirga splendida]|uniref:Glutathione S-transferase n=1 Tax=Microvirga splendida TaxID=2795727 RepID=A0ABS0Y756_9HYPH|nr:glutathione S-transferase [Microvirga splendida]MBJ6128123.1 glutathione S-transferase [Microvirga splendida]